MERYKHTELGWIPQDWNIDKLGMLTEKIGSGITPKGGESGYKNTGRPFVRSQNVGWGKLILSDIAFIDDETHKSFGSTEIKKGDVFLNITGASIGRSAIADGRLIGGNVNQHVCILRVKKDCLNSEFLNAFLISPKGQNLILSYQAGGNRQGLNYEQIKSFLIPFPSLAEQQSIAKILSAWNSAIETLTHLIAAKQQLKKGLMQQLLTGKKRLPGFEEDWEETRLGDVAEFRNGKAHENVIVEKGKFIVVTSKFISTEGQEYRSTNKNLSPLNSGEITMVMSDVPNGKALAKCYVINEDNKYTLNQRICSIKAIKANNYFLYFLLNRNNYFLAFDTGVGQTNLKKDEILDCPLIIPPLNEQKEISKIIKSVDYELSILSLQLEEYKQQKKGLMQQLLTGKKRVKV